MPFSPGKADYQDVNSDDEHMSMVSGYARKSKKRGTAFALLLIVSLLCNVLAAIKLVSDHLGVSLVGKAEWVEDDTRHANEPHSQVPKFAGLTRDIPRPWLPTPVDNETAQDELWNATRFDLGNIALDDSYAKSMGLPRAQRFPWDASKGVYLINAYHNLHCVVTLRQALVEHRTGVPQSTAWGHLKHCLMVLREEVMCDASDTPRYTGFQSKQKSGMGQFRMCRSWSKLEDWAREHTACWRHEGRVSDEGFRELDRYRFCPPGSPYEEQAKTAWLRRGS